MPTPNCMSGRSNFKIESPSSMGIPVLRVWFYPLSDRFELIVYEETNVTLGMYHFLPGGGPSIRDRRSSITVRSLLGEEEGRCPGAIRK